MNTAPMPSVEGLVPDSDDDDLVCWEGPDGTILVLTEGEGDLAVYRSSEATQRDREGLDWFLAQIGYTDVKADEMHIIGDTGVYLYVTRLYL